MKLSSLKEIAQEKMTPDLWNVSKNSWNETVLLKLVHCHEDQSRDSLPFIMGAEKAALCKPPKPEGMANIFI